MTAVAAKVALLWSLAIRSAMERVMRGCDAMIVNLTPFRGPSADVGSAYEMGFMRARRDLNGQSARARLRPPSTAGSGHPPCTKLRAPGERYKPSQASRHAERRGPFRQRDSLLMSPGRNPAMPEFGSPPSAHLGAIRLLAPED
jgi:Nucleoside 2-deoxyribosyltransferase